MREYCDIDGGLGAQVEVRPWNSAERVCEQGHRWFTNPVPGTEHPLPRICPTCRHPAHPMFCQQCGCDLMTDPIP